jgi:hypothetical protein
VHGKDAFLDEGVWPHDVEQLALAQQMAGSDDERRQQIVCLRRQSHPLTAANERSFTGIERELPEPVKFASRHVGFGES